MSIAPPRQTPPNPDRPARANNCNCDCHEFDIAHVAPCCYPTAAEREAWYSYEPTKPEIF